MRSSGTGYVISVSSVKSCGCNRRLLRQTVLGGEHRENFEAEQRLIGDCRAGAAFAPITTDPRVRREQRSGRCEIRTRDRARFPASGRETCP